MHHLGGGGRRLGARRPAADNLLEALTELAGHVVIDDRVGARIAVRHAVPQHADHLVCLARRRRAEVGHERVDVVRQPREAEDDDDEDDDAGGARRALARLRVRVRRAVATLQEAHDEHVEHADEEEGERVGEHEERDEHRPDGVARDAAVRVAVERLHAVREEGGDMQAQHHDPDERDQHDDVPPGAVRLARATADDKQRRWLTTGTEHGSRYLQYGKQKQRTIICTIQGFCCLNPN